MPLYVNINVSIKEILVLLYVLLFYFSGHTLFSDLFYAGDKEVNTSTKLDITSAHWLVSFLWIIKTLFAWLAA